MNQRGSKAPSESSQHSRRTTAVAGQGLDRSADPGSRWLVAKELAGRDDSDAVEALSKLLTDGDMRVRQQAARSLGEIGAPARAAVPSLLEALFDGEGPVRVAATRALGAIGDKSAIPGLLKVADTTAWDTLHSWATDSLVRLGAPEAAAHLMRRLESERAWQRRWAARELSPIGTADALPALLEARKRDLLHRRTYTRAIREINLRTSMGESDAVE
jgi:HEAT repeat protein